MRITASMFYGLHQPSTCDLRAYLRAKGVKESKPSPYEEVVIELGQRYEDDQFAKIGECINLSNGDEDQRVAQTLEHVRRGSVALYQPTFRAEIEINGTKCIVVGQPDFLIRDGGEYAIRDVKLSRRINEKDHPEILFQLGIYGLLYERNLGKRPTRLEVLAGSGATELIPLDYIDKALREAQRLVSVITASSEPFSPVGWSKCGGCAFKDRCWPLAVEGRDVGTVPGIDQGLVRALRDEGVSTIAELLERFDEARLSNFERPWGGRKQRVGKSAQKILRLARALATGKEEVIQKPKIPDSPDYVMFDLEGLPPQLDDLDKIYLWGMQVFGTNPSDYIGKVAGLGPNGDREGWLQFLAAAKLLFDKYGDIPFVHWHVYEKTHLHRYIERYGDAEGIAARIAKNLFDLLPATQESIALPISSYSLKVVEEYVGYKRTQDEYGGDWAMATFIKATETSDSNEREKMLKEILIYNKEDLAATWAVLQWLRGKSLQ